MVYRLPTDSDGVKYHGVVDGDGDNPGQVLYGVDEHGNYRPVNVDSEGNVLTRVTGSIVEDEVLGDLSIPAGSNAFTRYVRFDSEKFTVAILRVEGGNKYRVAYAPRVVGSQAIPGPSQPIIIPDEERVVSVSGVFPTLSESGAIRVYNLGTESDIVVRVALTRINMGGNN